MPTFYCKQTTYRGIERVSRENCPSIDGRRSPGRQLETLGRSGRPVGPDHRTRPSELITRNYGEANGDFDCLDSWSDGRRWLLQPACQGSRRWRQSGIAVSGEGGSILHSPVGKRSHRSRGLRFFAGKKLSGSHAGSHPVLCARALVLTGP
jgi:hypothetical protein